MRLFFSVVFVFAFLSCKSQHGLTNSYAESVEVLWNSTNSINELSATTNDEKLNLRLNSVFQALSENKELSSDKPKERVKEKTQLLEQCSESIDNCKYTPEGYSIETARNFLNITYQCNQYSSYDTYYKYAVVDLVSAKRLVYSDMFTSPELILKKYNAKYIKKKEDYLLDIDPTDLTEDQQEEYEIIRNHIDTRDQFKQEDLNNLELIFDSNLNRFTEIRFHYNGSGGNDKMVLTRGYVSFELGELENLLVEEFKRLIENQ